MEENTEWYLLNLEVNKNFLNRREKAITIKESIDELDFITSKNLGLTKGIIGKTKSTYKPVIKRYTI